MSSIQKQTQGAGTGGKQASLAKKATAYLMTKGLVHRFELMEHLNMSIGAMNVMHPYLEWCWESVADYNKTTKTWKLKDKVESSNG